ncbi:hypothetical protein ESCO_000290 [Escovopsis weberi]|uniref:Fibronectin type-III domain-containing protein n=1 Tax=Escovopsis weberi TaxID=150374 RepID=A0A0N0RTE0_ESCWE|nr:hypothetical protein ESCO_000290 [Escovopsis weberi]
MSWEPSALTLLTCCLVGLWWIGSPHPGYQKAVYLAVCAVPLLVDPRPLLQSMYSIAHDVLPLLRLDELLAHNFKMVLTLGAVLWLLHRSWQTLWKPVPDLINILGVDIPEPPDVSLAGIRSDAATLSWTRPSSHRPVQKYSIQVNGVHVGDSPGNEVAITVTGLKPNHFYNIRVVAVGPNNFQAGSALVRLRTFGKDGRPQLGNSRLPTSFTDPEPLNAGSGDDESDDSDDPTFSMPSVEAAPVLDGGSSAVRDSNGTVSGQRRNTINRRHSPSVASMDQPQIRSPIHDGPELSLDELNRKFEGIRKEIDDTLILYAKDEAESLHQEEELKKEKERKRQILREKEEQTAQLKATARITMEQMRAAEKERTKREQQLREKEVKKSEVRETIKKLEGEIQRMVKERSGFETQVRELSKKRDSDVIKLDEANAKLQEKCAELEAELKDKGKQLQDLKETRESLPDAHDDQWKEEDARLKREWELRRREMHNRLTMENGQAQMLDQQIRILAEQLNIHQSNAAFYNQLGASSSVEFDMSPSTQSKRLSHRNISRPNTTHPSPAQIAPAEPSFAPAEAGFGHASFAPALFMDMAADGASDHQTEAESKASNGPLSPSAQTLLPSNIFDETEESDSKERRTLFLTDLLNGSAEDPQSPTSSHHSFNYFSSPHGSTRNLPYGPFGEGNDRRPSLAISHAATPPRPASHRLSNILAPFHRKATSKAAEDGFALGSLKPGQSQSFPRQTDEQEVLENRRRLNFSWMTRSSAGPDDTMMRSPYSSSTKAHSARRLNPFASSSSALFPERDPDSSRPPSIASTDLPRPSTDSGSIWGNPADAPFGAKNRLWSPSDGRWPSRAGSRRPSLHGTTSVLTTTLASAEDEILDERDLLNPQTSPSQVGVIGSRPPGTASSMMSQRLNPNAPTFMGSLFRKDREGGIEKERSKGSRDKSRGGERRDDKGKAQEARPLSLDLSAALDVSPAHSHVSRGAYSTHAHASACESRESLALESAVSNTPSDAHSYAGSIHKDQENVVRKLFRKGSFSKFSLSSRLGKESGLFKKGPGSATNSDRTASVDHQSSMGDVDDLGEDLSHLGRSFDSVGSSSSLGPSRSRESREGRMTSWRFSMKKKSKESSSRDKESSEVDRPTDEE